MEYPRGMASEIPKRMSKFMLVESFDRLGSRVAGDSRKASHHVLQVVDSQGRGNVIRQRDCAPPLLFIVCLHRRVSFHANNGYGVFQDQRHEVISQANCRNLDGKRGRKGACFKATLIDEMEFVHDSIPWSKAFRYGVDARHFVWLIRF